MKTNERNLLAGSVALALSLVAGQALAESSYGYGDGTGSVTAQASVNLQIDVPLTIMLRVGSQGTTIDELQWAAGLDLGAGTYGNNQTLTTWDGSAPGFSLSTTEAAELQAYAWTNSAGNGQLSFSVEEFTCADTVCPTEGMPRLAQIGVETETVEGELLHPGSHLNSAAGATQTFTSLVEHESTWTYTPPASANSWFAGSYTAKVTYVATTL